MYVLNIYTYFISLDFAITIPMSECQNIRILNNIIFKYVLNNIYINCENKLMNQSEFINTLSKFCVFFYAHLKALVFETSLSIVKIHIAENHFQEQNSKCRST